MKKISAATAHAIGKVENLYFIQIALQCDLSFGPGHLTFASKAACIELFTPPNESGAGLFPLRLKPPSNPVKLTGSR